MSRALVLVPGDARDYRDREQVLADWMSDVDFELAGRYVNRLEAEAWMMHNIPVLYDKGRQGCRLLMLQKGAWVVLPDGTI